MAPGYHELIIYCGTTVSPTEHYYDYAIDGSPVNLSGAQITLAARNKSDAEIFCWRTHTGEIILYPQLGRIGLNLTAQQTAALQTLIKGVATRIQNGMPLYTVGAYSLEINNGGNITRLLHGPVTLSPEYAYA